MRFEYRVTVEAELDEGKFESRATIGDVIVEALEGANPDTIEGENGGSYSLTDWTVEEIEQGKRK